MELSSNWQKGKNPGSTVHEVTAKGSKYQLEKGAVDDLSSKDRKVAVEIGPMVKNCEEEIQCYSSG